MLQQSLFLIKVNTRPALYAPRVIVKVGNTGYSYSGQSILISTLASHHNVNQVDCMEQLF